VLIGKAHVGYRIELIALISADDLARNLTREQAEKLLDSEP
jgi:hypothetical protein